MATIQEVYIALFGRPADPIGYNYYVEATDDGANLDAVGDLSASAEYNARFEGMSEIQMVNQIYMDLFGRDADAAGLTFYVGLLNSGEATQQDIAIRIIDGATGDDAEIIANKVEAAQLFTDSLDTGSEIAAYDGEAAAEAGRAYLDGVTGDDDTIPTQEEVDATIEAIEDGDFGVPGDIFTLTVNADVIEGTNNDDNIRAFADGANPTLQSSDTINGGGGSDTLNLSAGSLAASAAPVINGVERINNANTVTFDLTAVNGAGQIWSTDASGDYVNADLSTTFGTQLTATGAIDIDIEESTTGSSDTLMLAADDNVGTTSFTSTGDAASIENITVAALGGSGSDAADVVSLDAFVGLESLTVTGEGNIAIDADTAPVVVAPVAPGSTEIETVDLSAATGNVSVDVSELTQDVTVTGGSGVNVVVTGSGDDLLVGAGGNDDLDGGAGDDIYGGGAGNDTIDLAGGGNDEVHFDAGQGQDTVTGFGVAADVDVISFLDGGAIDFANSEDDSGRGDSDLDFDDYQERATLADIAAGDDQKVIEITDVLNTSTNDISLTNGAAVEAYVAVYDGTDAFIYYDADWSDTAGRQLVAEIDGVATVGSLTEANFDVYV